MLAEDHHLMASQARLQFGLAHYLSLPSASRDSRLLPGLIRQADDLVRRAAEKHSLAQDVQSWIASQRWQAETKEASIESERVSAEVQEEDEPVVERPMPVFTLDVTPPVETPRSPLHSASSPPKEEILDEVPVSPIRLVSYPPAGLVSPQEPPEEERPARKRAKKKPEAKRPKVTRNAAAPPAYAKRPPEKPSSEPRYCYCNGIAFGKGSSALDTATQTDESIRWWPAIAASAPKSGSTPRVFN
jgi:hypothetical protein